MTRSGGSDSKLSVGLGVAVCTACCAGPILGVIAAIGLTTLAGVLVAGFSLAVAGAVAVAVVFVRRRRRRAVCGPEAAESIAVALGQTSAGRAAGRGEVRA